MSSSFYGNNAWQMPHDRSEPGEWDDWEDPTSMPPPAPENEPDPELEPIEDLVIPAPDQPAAVLSEREPILRRHHLLLILGVLLGAASALYIWLVSENISGFPAFLSPLEAAQTSAAEAVRTGVHRSTEPGWPILFKGLGQYDLSLTVYVQAMLQLYLGPAPHTGRFQTICLSLLAMIALSILAGRLGSFMRALVIVPMLATVTPLWLVQARGGMPVAVAAFAWLGILAWLPALQREQSSEDAVSTAGKLGLWSLLAVVCFYSAPAGRLWLPATLLILTATTLPRLASRPEQVFAPLALAFGTALPFIAIALTNPALIFGDTLDLLLKVPVVTAPGFLDRGLARVFTVLNPSFWFVHQPGSTAALLFSMPDRAFLPAWLLPFAILGILALVRRSLRSTVARSLLLVLPVGALPAFFPSAGALDCMPVGLCYLTYGAVGILSVISFVEERFNAPLLATAAVQCLLLFAALNMRSFIFSGQPALAAAHAPHMTGYGAPQLFDWIRKNGGQHQHIHFADDLFPALESYNTLLLPEDLRAKAVTYNSSRRCLGAIGTEAGLWILSAERFTAFEEQQCPFIAEPVHLIGTPKEDPLFYIVRLRAPTSG